MTATAREAANPLGLPDWFLKIIHDRKHVGHLSYDQLDRLMDEFKALWMAVEDLKQENGDIVYEFAYEYDSGDIIYSDTTYDAEQVRRVWPDAVASRWHLTLRRIHLVAVQSKIVRTVERPADA